jgi:hypothetical protein
MLWTGGVGNFPEPILIILNVILHRSDYPLNMLRTDDHSTINYTLLLSGINVHKVEHELFLIMAD